MRAADEFRLQEYQDLGPFEGSNKIRLKRHPEDGRICLEKRLSYGTKSIYETLQKRVVFGVPEIFLCVEDGEELIVIEKYIEGKPLSDLIEKGPMTWHELLPVIDSLCQTLHGLHQADAPIICRDLKAENIIMDENGQPWLVDFDIARFYQDGKTRDTTLLGTAEYAAPEQFGFFQTDQRTDIYSLGVLINYMATGKFPVETMAHGVLGDIVRTCTHLDPKQRYQSVMELQADLDKLKKDLGMELPAEKQNEALEKSFLLPGFRSGNKFHMVLAAAGYGLVAWFCFTLPLTMDDIPLTGFHLRLQQGAIFLSQILFICYLFRYRDWGGKIPFLRSRILLFRTAGLAAAWIVLICGAAVLCVLGEGLFF